MINLEVITVVEKRAAQDIEDRQNVFSKEVQQLWNKTNLTACSILQDNKPDVRRYWK